MPRLKASGATVEHTVEPLDLAVTAGAVRLQQVLLNLLSNAADAAEQSSDRRIRIVASRHDGKVLIDVRDYGPGVPDSVRERIFDPFYSTKGVGKGLGLGLSISYNIIKDFGGQLTVSNPPGGGALFQIELVEAAQTLKEAAE